MSRYKVTSETHGTTKSRYDAAIHSIVTGGKVVLAVGYADLQGQYRFKVFMGHAPVPVVRQLETYVKNVIERNQKRENLKVAVDNPYIAKLLTKNHIGWKAVSYRAILEKDILYKDTRSRFGNLLASQNLTGANTRKIRIKHPLKIYTDASWHPSTKIAGLAAITVTGRIWVDYLLAETAQDAEISAVLLAYNQINFEKTTNVTIITDSQPLVDAWEKYKKTKTEGTQRYKNGQLLELFNNDKCSLAWIKGHDNNYWNEHADMLSKAAYFLYQP